MSWKYALRMNQNEPSHTTSAPYGPTTLDAEGEVTFGRQNVIKWPWTALLMAHVMPGSSDTSSTAACRVLMLSPTADGLEALEGTECMLTDLWLVFIEADGAPALHGERVEEISTWNSCTPGGRQLSILHCEGGRQVAIEDDLIFDFQSIPLAWKRVGRGASMSNALISPPDSSIERPSEGHLSGG